MTPEQIAKLIEANKVDAHNLREGTSNKWYVSVLIDMLERQQKIIEWLITRDNERTGDGK